MKTMKMKTKKMLSLLLAVIMIFGTLPMLEAAAKTSGKLTYEVKDGKATIIECDKSVSGKFEIPSKLGGYPVTKINDAAFANCTKLTGVIVPDGVTSIGWGAFDGCTGLKSITIPDSTVRISGAAFSGTAYYNKSSNWDDGVLYIGKHLIEAKSSVKGSYKIKSGTVCVASYAFYNCSDLVNITIPDSVIAICNYAFDGTACYNDPSNWKSGALYIGKHLIEAKSSLKGSYKVKSGTKCIAENAFCFCDGITDIILPESLTVIGAGAFEYCDSLKSITVPGSVEYIGEKALGYSDDNSGFKIYGHKGSAADTYAEENGFKFVSHKNVYTSKVTAKATISKNGKITYTCDCGYSFTKPIAKIKSVTLSSSAYTYNGKVKKPTVTVKDSDGDKLKEGTDYTVTYSSGRKYVGKYTVTVTFKGNYSGTEKLTFTIKPKSTSVYSLTAGAKKFTAKWYTRTEQTSGYQLQYSTSSSMKNAKSKTLSGTSKNSLTVSSLKANTKYYVRVRTYKNVKINGKIYKYYSAWSSVKSVKTK